MAISYIMLRRVPAAAMAVANRTVSLKAAHGHGQELYGTQRTLISSMFFSSSTSKSKKQKEKVVVSSSSSDSDEDGSDVWSSESDLSDHDSDHGDSVTENPVDYQNSPNQAPESEPTMAILDIIGSKLQRKSKTSTVKRSYGKEEISVYISTDAIDAGKDIIPFEVTTTKETKQGSFSLFFRIHAFPEKLDLTACYTIFTNASGSQLQEKLPLSEFRRLNLSTSFIEYLSARGINPTTINALRAAGNDSLKWMKNLKKFIEM
ncbi:Mitochondrial glycoprotein [Corchorus olitorius]|uniref:Mitochondrial glycoprotein n=1 Tax=Corchorus olitorius TaxID=93759 RepID=A0A1R3JRB2_9ROSI|nr:Mitochondrial glycoprotein [Corchorus olitorius]